MSALRTSRRSLFILQEIRKAGQDLGLPHKRESEDLLLPSEPSSEAWYYCDVEFPLTKALVAEKGDEAFSDLSRFKLINVHVHVLQGPYEGGSFVMEIDLRPTPDYPNEPPKCRYLTKIWHPNVHEESGRICHSHLRGPSDPRPGTWNPMLRLQPLILGILGHFNPEDSAFEPLDPLNPIAASQFLNDEAGFMAQAKAWTLNHAKPVNIEPENLAT